MLDRRVNRPATKQDIAGNPHCVLAGQVPRSKGITLLPRAAQYESIWAVSFREAYLNATHTLMAYRGAGVES